MKWARVAPGPGGRIPAYGRTPQEAEQNALQLELEAKRQQSVTQDLPLFDKDSFAWFLYNVWKPRTYPHVRKTTIRKYDSLCTQHILPGIGHLKIADIGYHEMTQMVAGLTRKDKPYVGKPLPDRQKFEVIMRTREILGLYATLQRAQQKAFRDDWRLVKTPDKPKKKKRIEPEEDFTILLMKAVAGTWIEGPIFAALFLGLRRGEICGLTKKKIDRTNLTITVSEQLQPESKGELVDTKGDERVLPVTAEILEWVDRLSDPNSIFVFTKKGKPIHPDYLSKQTPVFVAKAELRKCTLHDLRSYAASNLISLGVDLVTVMEILGHEKIDTSLIYVNAKNKAKRAALAKLLRNLGGKVDEQSA